MQLDFEEIVTSASPEVPMNDNFLTANHVAVYGRSPLSSALTWAYAGGRWSGFAITAGTLSLTNNTLNYIVVARSTGVISVSTASTNWDNTNDYARVYKVTPASGVVPLANIEDHRAGLYGIHGPNSAANVQEFRGLTFTSDTGSTADSDPGNGLFKWNNATQSSATVLYFDDQTADGVSLTTLWSNLASTGFIHLQQNDDATKWQVWRWTAAPVDGTGYRKFTASLQASGGSIADNKVVLATFTNDRSTPTFIAPRVTQISSSATPTPNADTTDCYEVTALAADATFGAPTGSPVNFQALMIRITDNGTPRALSWNAAYRAFGSPLPTTTTANKTIIVGANYNATDAKWDCMPAQEEQ